MTPARILSVACAAAALVALAAGCGAAGQQGVLLYRARLPDGTAPSEAQLRNTATKLDIRLGEAGIERRDVAVIPPDRVRVVLPESMVSRIPELRAVLERAEGLPTVPELLRQGD